MKNILVLCLLITVAPVWAQSTQQFAVNGVAIRGYDPVAYFNENAAVKGDPQITYSWQGVEWHFRNEANLRLFKANPEKYAPQFGGFCAYGVSENHKSPTDPQAFTIVNDKLYLNYNLKVKELWTPEQTERIAAGEKNWVELKNKKD